MFIMVRNTVLFHMLYINKKASTFFYLDLEWIEVLLGEGDVNMYMYAHVYRSQEVAVLFRMLYSSKMLPFLPV